MKFFAATAFGRNGLQDWILQRLSAVYLLIYFLYLTTVIIYYNYSASGFTYNIWYEFFYNPIMQVATTIALASIIAHAWIGMWTVITDYIKPLWIRLVMQLLIFGSLIMDLIWGLKIVWGT